MDLQDRLGADRDTDLVLAMSTGLQCGNISVACSRFRPPSDSPVTREWLHRTVMAVCLVHEVKVFEGTADCVAVQNLMEEFGYGRDDCKVYRYWDDGFPLTTEGAAVRALVLARGGRSMLAVGSYGDGGECVLKLDLKALGLGETVRAYDAERRARGKAAAEPGSPPAADPELKRAGPGVFVLPIRKHDFALIVVE